MGRIEKIKRELIEESNIRILGEQESTDVVDEREIPEEIVNFMKTYYVDKKFHDVHNENGEIIIRRVPNKMPGVNYRRTWENWDDEGKIFITVEDINTYEKNKSNLNKCIERKKEGDEWWNRNWRTLRDVNLDQTEDSVKKVNNFLNEKYPNVEYCNVVMKVHKIAEFH